MAYHTVHTLSFFRLWFAIIPDSHGMPYITHSVFSDSGLLSPLFPILDAMRDRLETALKDLQSHLNAHRHGPLSASMRTQKPAAWQPVSSIGQLRQTYTAVHSLELHLLAALKRWALCDVEFVSLLLCWSLSVSLLSLIHI